MARWYQNISIEKINVTRNIFTFNTTAAKNVLPWRFPWISNAMPKSTPAIVINCENKIVRQNYICYLEDHFWDKTRREYIWYNSQVNNNYFRYKWVVTISLVYRSQVHVVSDWKTIGVIAKLEIDLTKYKENSYNLELWL